MTAAPPPAAAGSFRATATGEPVRVSVCHCLDCKKRSGSAFAVQARWPAEQVGSRASRSTWVSTADSGNRITFHFCPDCGSTSITRSTASSTDLVAIPLGAFDDPYFASPDYSVWEERKHDWVEIVGETSSTSTDGQPPHASR